MSNVTTASKTVTVATATATKANKLVVMPTKDEAKASAIATLKAATVAYCDAIATAAVTYAALLRTVAKELVDSGFTAAEAKAIIKENSSASEATVKRAILAAFGPQRKARKEVQGYASFAVKNGLATLKGFTQGGKAKGKKDEDEGDDEGDDEGETEAGECHTIETLSNLMSKIDRKIVEGAIVRWSALVGK